MVDRFEQISRFGSGRMIHHTQLPVDLEQLHHIETTYYAHLGTGPGLGDTRGQSRLQ